MEWILMKTDGMVIRVWARTAVEAVELACQRYCLAESDLVSISDGEITETFGKARKIPIVLRW